MTQGMVVLRHCIPSLCALLAGCAHVTNTALCTAASCSFVATPDSTYRFSPKADKETLVIVTLSGGGTRAAALAFGTLQTLAELPAAMESKDTRSASLLDQVDIISSVSGGSVTAGWYALKGQEGLAQSDTSEAGRLWKFLNTKLTGKLAWDSLNPWTLGRYTFTTYERNDVLADFFDHELFDKMTYAAVLQRYKEHSNQPYVILNATDLGHEAIFPFTQGRFDLLCSDIRPYRLADAVAASANFPLAFSAMGLQNYSGCAAQKANSWAADGPAQWLGYYDRFESPNGRAINSYGLNEVRSARLAEDYLQSPLQGDRDKYVHLLDGGVADNLGIRSTLVIEDDPARVPSLYLRLSQGLRPDGYQNIRRILYVVVNARTRNPGALDQHKGPPGEIPTALRMTDTQLDSSTLADQDYLIAELEAIANSSRDSTVPTGTDIDHGPFLSNKSAAQARHPKPDGPLNFYVVSVDFEMISDKTCRDHAWLLPTSWGLEHDQVEALRGLAAAILRNSPDLAKFYRDTNHSELKADHDAFRRPCELLKAH